MKYKTNTIARHGDILLKKTNKVMGRKKDTRTLALGEVTGHHHTMYGGVVTSYADKDEVVAVDVKEAVSLKHQEHKPIKVLPGVYKVYRKFEFDPFADVLRRVRD